MEFPVLLSNCLLRADKFFKNWSSADHVEAKFGQMLSSNFVDIQDVISIKSDDEEGPGSSNIISWKQFFYVMASGGLYSSFYINNSQSL